MNNILQFKITLKHSNPKIWRRFQVENNITFHELHLIIQLVMGWGDTHLYQFVYQRNNFIGDPEMLGSNDIVDAKATQINKVFEKPKTRIIYEYDFGDGWEHELIMEKLAEKIPTQQYPFCLKGAMSCPPDDCGGFNGYENFLEILKDKKHPEYEEISEWMGEDFDPNDFDVEAINEQLLNYEEID